MNEASETLADYYRTRREVPFLLKPDLTGRSHFNIAKMRYSGFKSPYNRRDFYKITLVIGKGEIFYGGKTILIDRPALLFPCPTEPYSWTCLSKEQEGYCCLFNSEFFAGYGQFEQFKKTQLFKPWGPPVVFLGSCSLTVITTYFGQIAEMAASDYVYKQEVIRNLICLVLHHVIAHGTQEKEHPVPTKAAPRLLQRFYMLLQSQFPLDSPASPLLVKTPSDFAKTLNVHVNHLNSVIKKATGKTTGSIIRAAIMEEAKTLLSNTLWDIAQVGYCLGFEEPAHFHNFFKKNTGLTPMQYRKVQEADIL